MHDTRTTKDFMCGLMFLQHLPRGLLVPSLDFVVCTPIRRKLNNIQDGRALSVFSVFFGKSNTDRSEACGVNKRLHSLSACIYRHTNFYQHAGPRGSKGHQNYICEVASCWHRLHTPWPCSGVHLQEWAQFADRPVVRMKPKFIRVYA